MKLVTLVHATFHRIGSATRSGFTTGQNRSLEITKEISDDDPETLREFVLSIAEKNGDSREALMNMKADATWGQSNPTTIFNISSANTFYSTPYAECRTFTAMKVENRYFKLDEITI